MVIKELLKNIQCYFNYNNTCEKIKPTDFVLMS